MFVFNIICRGLSGCGFRRQTGRLLALFLLSSCNTKDAARDLAPSPPPKPPEKEECAEEGFLSIKVSPKNCFKPAFQICIDRADTCWKEGKYYDLILWRARNYCIIAAAGQCKKLNDNGQDLPLQQIKIRLGREKCLFDGYAICQGAYKKRLRGPQPWVCDMESGECNGSAEERCAK